MSDPSRCAGVVVTACTQGKRTQHGKPDGVVGCDDQPEIGDNQKRALWGGGKARSTEEVG